MVSSNYFYFMTMRAIKCDNYVLSHTLYKNVSSQFSWDVLVV